VGQPPGGGGLEPAEHGQREAGGQHTHRDHRYTGGWLHGGHQRADFIARAGASFTPTPSIARVTSTVCRRGRQPLPFGPAGGAAMVELVQQHSDVPPPWPGTCQGERVEEILLGVAGRSQTIGSS
jgi:hypothetical protein